MTETMTVDVMKALGSLRRDLSELAVGVEYLRSNVADQLLDAQLDDLVRAERNQFYHYITALILELHQRLGAIGCQAGELYPDSRKASSGTET